MRVDHVENYRLPKHLMEKEEGVIDAAKQGPGHAYSGQELANEYSLEQGQDLFAPPPPAAVAAREKGKLSRKSDDDDGKEEKQKRKEERQRIRTEKEERRRKREQKRTEKGERKREKRARKMRESDDESSNDDLHSKKHKSRDSRSDS